MAKIQYIKDKEGAIVFPITHERSVKDSHGVLLEDKLNNLASTLDLNNKQDKLVSGENIKTINGESVLGAGDITIHDGVNGTDGAPGPKGDDGKSINSVIASAAEDYTKQPLTVEASIIPGESDNTLVLKFYNFKGNKGNTGDRGPVGVNSVQATVDNLSGVPSVASAIVDGVLMLAFSGLKGIQGNPGVSSARQVVVAELPEASGQTSDTVYLKQIGNTDEYERWVTQFNGVSYSWIMIGTTEMSLDDYIRKDDILYYTEDEISEIGLFDSTKFYVTYEDEEV